MTEIAAVVLAHSDARQVHRFICALDDVPVFLHCDAKTPSDVARDMLTGLPSRVTVCERMPTSLASWSLVNAELSALRLALARTSAQHIVVASGSDYPLVTMQQLVEDLDGWHGSSHFWNTEIPFARWNTRTHPDGGRWRFEHRFLTRRDHVIYVRGVPLRVPHKRAVPRGLRLRASSQWKIYARRHAQALLDIVDRRTDLVNFWRSTLVPEESFAASVLGSPALVGSEGLQPCRANAWYLDWPAENTDHPAWLDSTIFEKLRAARFAEPMSPADAFSHSSGTDGESVSHRKWFARKFSTTVDTEVLDRMDAELRR